MLEFYKIVNKNHMPKILLLFCALFSSFTYAGWSQTGRIIEIYNHGYTVMVRMDGGFIRSSSGTCTGKDYYAIDKGNERFEVIYPQLLMAYASGSKTRFWLDDAKCSGQKKAFQTITTIKSIK